MKQNLNIGITISAALLAVLHPTEISSVNVLDQIRPLKRLEQVRVESNSLRQTSGDQYVFNYGRNLTEHTRNSEPTVKKLDALVEHGAELMEANGIHDNVKPLYRSIGVQLLEAVGENLEKRGDTKDTLVTKKRLEKYNIHSYSKQSWYQKILRSIRDGNLDYVKKRTKDRFFSLRYFLFGPIRSELNGKIDNRLNTELSRDEIEVFEHFIDGKRIFYSTRSSRSNTGMDYLIDTDRNLSEQELRKKYDDKLLLFAVGAYTAGSNKPASFVIEDGKTKNYLLADYDGLLVVYKDKSFRIVRRRDLRLSDLTRMQSDTQKMDIASSLYDFSNIAGRESIDMFQSHLLVHNGELLVSKNAPQRIEERRALVEYDGGSYGIVSSPQDFGFSLFEFATLLRRIPGIRTALNLDVGYNDFSGLVANSGESFYFGNLGRDRCNNLIVITKK